jgi:hypothetical protein
MNVVTLDSYTKTVLTVIAVCLLALCLKEGAWVSEVDAVEESEVIAVRLVGISEEIKAIPVHVDNQNLTVSVNNRFLDVVINDPMLFGNKKRDEKY